MSWRERLAVFRGDDFQPALRALGDGDALARLTGSEVSQRQWSSYQRARLADALSLIVAGGDRGESAGRQPFAGRAPGRRLGEAERDEQRRGPSVEMRTDRLQHQQRVAALLVDLPGRQPGFEIT